ncbi:MAG: hypothetical protein ACXWBP_12140 [Limisphaerales bacterium]
MSLKDELCSTPAGKSAYYRERFVFGLANDLCAKMTADRVTRAQMAKRLNHTKADVDAILDGARGIEPILEMFTELGYAIEPIVRTIGEVV